MLGCSYLACRCLAPFWCAPPEVVDAEHQKWADRKGLGRRLDGKSWKTKQLMTSASRERLRKWEDNARTANVSPHVIMNTTQRGAPSQPRCQPTTGSALFCMSKQRLLHHEMLEVQGWPILTQCPFLCPLRGMVFDSEEPVAAAAWRRMAGNSMSLPCLGALLLFQLAFLQPQPSTLTTPEAPPAASVAPAVARENETQLDFEETQCESMC